MYVRLFVAGIIALSFVQPLTAQEAQSKKFISEATVKLASAMAYSNLLEQAQQKGWRYRESDIESGFKHHYEELRLRLIDDGYTILPADTGPTQ